MITTLKKYTFSHSIIVCIVYNLLCSILIIYAGWNTNNADIDNYIRYYQYLNEFDFKQSSDPIFEFINFIFSHS